MSGSHIARPPAKMNTDIVVVGGGLSGTLAAYLLGRAGYAVTLIDRHRVFPQEFRSEKLGEDHIGTLQRFGLLAAISARATVFDTVANIHHGRLLDCTHRRHYGILYHDLVETIRAELPDTVRFVTGQVNGVRTSARRQRIAILGQDEVTARFLVLATGPGDMLRRDLGISRRTIRARQSIAFGFNLHLFDLDCFPRAGLNHAGVTCYGEHAADGIDYLTLFPVAGATRANLFAYRDYGDSWVKALRDRPNETLIAAFPRLVERIGAFEVAGRIDSWVTDLTVAENHHQDGFVLIGDAFQTSCPAAGTSVGRLLSDVERLCHVHLPRWMREGALTAGDIASFYNDPEKRAADAHALEMADFRRGLTTGTDLHWRLRRQLHFARRRVMHVLDTVSPALGASLREIKDAHSRRTPPLLAPDRG